MLTSRIKRQIKKEVKALITYEAYIKYIDEWNSYMSQLRKAWLKSVFTYRSNAQFAMGMEACAYRIRLASSAMRRELNVIHHANVKKYIDSVFKA